MASYVYFKFKSQKEPQRVTIDGPHTDVWNLKREIINISRLGDGTDFDLKIYKENSNEEYTDDTEIIPKDSTVLARRLPASAPGKGRAARYVSGKPPVSAKPTTSTSSRPVTSVKIDNAMTEEEKLKAMLQLTGAQWQQKQEEMSHETRVHLQGAKPFNKKMNVPEGEPPHGYICYRCGKKGHWIQACPTNDDVNYDNKNRIKRTTGIPRSMLKKIDQSEVDKLDDAQRQHLMVNAEGEYVFAQADEKAWKKHLEQVKAAEAASQKVQVGDKELQDRGLLCPIDKRLFVDPMKTPCCGKTYCHECIENALLENDLTCPGCETENVSLEQLQPDEDLKTKIKEYEAEKANERLRSRSPTVAAESPKADPSASGSRPTSRDGSGSPPSTNGQSKKRSASDVEGSDTMDSLAAPAMKRQKSGDAVSPKPEADGQGDSEQQTNASEEKIEFPANMMPPDFSQMQQGNGMNMPMMPGFNPFMMNPMAMGMGMNGMNGMAGMNGMNFMNPGFNMMNGMGGMNGMNMFPQGNGNMGFGNQTPNWNMNQNQNQHQNQNWNNNGGNGYNKSNNFNRQRNFQPQQAPKQPAGLSGVPTGPKALTQQQQNFYPPSGPAGNKFSNQQRHVGNEEDNAYMRQPVNPHRHINRNKKARQPDYREL
ncbi:DWNN domain-containing protein [Exophiala viscosa]|uniref:DWNN domain-containing protein n=1 Tax=Exophiala viscosa TaxID=2486360 RepID=UPI00218DF0A5|nr:DWNN domain-containing protein [Exophiala viscosa]